MGDLRVSDGERPADDGRAPGFLAQAGIDFERIEDSLEGAGLKTAGHSGVG